MKKALLLLIGLLLTLPALHAQFEGTWGIGTHVGYASAIKRPGAGIHLHYYQTNNLRIAPSFSYFLEAKGQQLWMAETDLHYILPLNYAASLYPLAGIHYSNWRYTPKADGVATGEGVTHHRPGASLGLGFQHDIRYRVRANLEMKYQFIKDYSQLFITIGFGFWF